MVLMHDVKFLNPSIFHWDLKIATHLSLGSQDCNPLFCHYAPVLIQDQPDTTACKFLTIEFFSPVFCHFSLCHDSFFPNHHNFSPTFLSYSDKGPISEHVL